MDDSVLLYEHYINDDQWERTLAFPRGGLTYLISNGTIKFYAYEDYFYRNCLISMQLPIYIVDEYMHIDGEYDELDELVDILDRIFPTNDLDAQLEKYLMKIDADLLYQPIGDYALKSDIPDVSDFLTTDELVDALDDYYTKDEADARFQPIGDYLTSADTYSKEEIDDELENKLDASAYTPCDLSNYYTKQETSSKTDIDTALDEKADADDVYTKDESDAKYQVMLVAGDNITISGNVISSSGGGGEPVDAYTKAESDARYQPKGDYATKDELDLKADKDDVYTKTESDSKYQPKGDYATEQWVLNQEYITSSSTVFNDYYTTANTYNKTEIDEFITNITNQISALTEAIEECCNCDTQYRWLTLTGSSDYICSGTTKYEKQQKQQSTNCGRTWTNVSPAEYQMGNVIETSSYDCGYIPSARLVMTDSTGGTYSLYCDIEHPETTDYLDVHGVKDLTYFDGISTTVISGFPSDQIKQSITDIEVGECVTSLGGQTFMDYSGVTSVTISDSLVYMNTQVYGNFQNCVNLECINIPDSVVYIAPRNFLGCSNLSKVIIGSGCTAIGDYTFSGCTSLKNIYVKATTPPTLVDVSLVGIDNLTNIYVPVSSVNAYKTASGWSEYTDLIIGVDIFPSECESVKFKGILAGGSSETAKTVSCNESTTITSGETRSANVWRKLYIGECADTIGEGAFINNQISNIAIPSNINRIENRGFMNSNSATSVSFADGIVYIGDSAFVSLFNTQNIVIPSSVTQIGNQAFYLNRFRTVVIGSGITSIGDEAFVQDINGGYNTMESVTIKATTPPTVDLNEATFPFDAQESYPIYVPAQSVDTYKTAWSRYASRINPTPISGKWLAAYSDSTVLTSECTSNNTIIGKDEIALENLTFVQAGDCVDRIGSSAFTSGTSISSVLLSDSITSIGTCAFSGCTSLAKINIPSGVTNIESNAFYNCRSLQSINIPSGVTAINNSTFTLCSSLRNITIPDSVITIDGFAFNYCTNLTSVTIGSGVTSIGNRSFNGCNGLTSIEIPSGVTSIGDSAFQSCTSLTSVTLEATTPPTLGSLVFSQTNNCPIYVPAASVDTYKAASGWSTYSSRIQAIQS